MELFLPQAQKLRELKKSTLRTCRPIVYQTLEVYKLDIDFLVDQDTVLKAPT